MQLIFDRRVTRRTPGALPHPRPDRGRRPLAPRRVQEVQGQAVPQRRPGPSHRNHHQRHLRLRDRSCAPQSARPAGDRLCRQPTVVTRRISEPRLPDRRRPPRTPSRHPSSSTTNAPPASASATAASTRSCTRSVSSRSRPPAFGIGTLRDHVAQLQGRDPDTYRGGRDDLRPPPAPAPRPHRARAAQPPLSHHADRRAGRHVLRAALYPGPPTRLLAAARRARPAPSAPSIGSTPRSPISWRRSNLRPEKLDSNTHTSWGQDS